MLMPYEVGSTYHVPPGTLLLERNIRDAKPDKELIASIKALGVLEPIGAVLNADGALLVRSGHRRTMGALEAKSKTVPVYVRGTDDTEDAAEISRIIEQHDENTHRAGLTTAENVGVVTQLAAFGLSADEISKQARIGKEHAAAAVRIAGSKMATKTAERYDDLTLDQVAAVAEFEDDEEAVKALVIAAHQGQFEHKVQRMRDDRDRDVLKKAIADQLVTDGYTVVDQRPSSYSGKARDLGRLVDQAKKDITVEAHLECPGRIAWVDFNYENKHPDGTWLDDLSAAELTAKYGDEEAVDKAFDDAANVQRFKPAYGCSDFAAHGHRDRYGNAPTVKAELSEKEREAAKAARKLVIENNKAWTAAETVRRAWIADFAQRKTPPTGTAAFIAIAITKDASAFSHTTSPGKVVAEWLGLKNYNGWSHGDLTTTVAKTTEARALVIALVHILGVYECSLYPNDWRKDGTYEDHGRYLRFLESAGYPLSDVEKFAINKKVV